MKQNNISVILKSIFAFLSALLILIYPQEASKSAVKSIDVCISSIIPSMFAFMVITTYIQSSGLYNILLRPIMKLIKLLIKADSAIVSVFILSLFGGYPIGVKLLKEIQTAQNINYPAITNSCINASTFCYCISPTFAIIMIGKGVFGSTEAGAVIYISNAIACLITGSIVSRSTQLSSEINVSCNKSSIIDAINSASRALFTICTVIIAFNTLLACIRAFLSDMGVTASPLLLGMLEISNLLSINDPKISLIPIISAISSFGGLCVLLQSCSIVKGAFSLKRFIVARIPCSLLSGFISYIILQFTDISVTVSTISYNYSFDFSVNKIIVLVLIAMCIIIFYKSDKIFEKV